MLNNLLAVFSFFNIGFLVSFLYGQHFVFNRKNSPNLIAQVALILTAFFGLYFLLITALVVGGAVKHSYLYLGFSMFFVLPFIIGKLVTYKKLTFYTNIQLICLFGSLFYSILLLMKNY